MAKLLAFEWDAREARVAVGHPRGHDLVLDDAFAVPLGDRDAPSDADDVGERVAAALRARNIGRGEVLVGIGRANIELKQMALPPSPDDELPDLVRFQAMRQFTTISSDWPLDFIPLKSDDNGGVNVLAAAVSPATVDRIQAICKTCDQSPKRLVLRPFAAASLISRRDRSEEAQPPRLLVDILADEADLTVLADKQVVLMRTVRLPAATGDDVARTKSMVGEIRRTIAAAQNQMQGQRIERVVLFGDGREQNALQESIEKELPYEVDVFDPLEAVKEGGSLAAKRPEHMGRFAPLIGMLLDEATGANHAIDFLNPRKKQEAPSNKRRNALIGATAASLALAVTLLAWFQLAAADAEIQELTDRSNSLKEAVTEAKGQKADLARLQRFSDGDIVWLDKLYELCGELTPDPASQESKSFLVTSIRMAAADLSGGEIVVDGFSRESGGIERLRNQLRERGFEVVPGPSSEDKNREDFRWSFSDHYRIKRDDPST